MLGIIRWDTAEVWPAPPCLHPTETSTAAVLYQSVVMGRAVLPNPGAAPGPASTWPWPLWRRGCTRAWPRYSLSQLPRVLEYRVRLSRDLACCEMGLLSDRWLHRVIHSASCKGHRPDTHPRGGPCPAASCLLWLPKQSCALPLSPSTPETLRSD